MIVNLVWIGGTLAALYAILLLLLFMFQERLLFLPSSRIDITPAAIGLEYKDVYFESENGVTLHGWFNKVDESAPTIIFSHGNAGNISGRIPMMEFYNRWGFNSFFYDYQGYGKSEGRPGEDEILADGLAAWDVLHERFGIPEEKLLPVGRSLGGVVAAHTALNRPARGLVLESAFTTVPDVAADVYRIFPVRALARIELSTIDRVKAFDGPLLIAHSPNDEVIPYHHGRALYEAAAGRAVWLELSGNHNDGYARTGAAYEKAYKTFIQKVFGDQP